MKTCPYCRKRIDVAATKCPHCASGFDGTQMEQGRKEHSRSRWGTLGVIILAIALGLWWLNDNVDELGETTAGIDGAVGAYE